MNDTIYMPVLRNRQVEFQAIEDVFRASPEFCSIIYPLFEIIQNKLRSNSKQTFHDDIEGFLSRTPGVTVLVDIVKETPRNSMAPAVTDFLLASSRHANFVRAQFGRLSDSRDRIIPVVSINEKARDPERYDQDALLMSELFGRIAYRIPVQHAEQLLPIVKKHAKPGDFILLDIDRAECTHPIIRNQCDVFSELSNNMGLVFIVLNNPRNENLRNKDLENNAPIYEINTALRIMFSDYLHAQGFGDYASISSAYPSTGGAISPAAVFYDGTQGIFMGFRGKTTQLSEFFAIARSIEESVAWKNLSDDHKQICPGCKDIQKRASGQIDGSGSQASWKRFTMEHYIYSMGEFLLSQR